MSRFKDYILGKMESRATDTTEIRERDGSGREWGGMHKNYSMLRLIMLEIDPASAIRAGGGLEQEVSQELDLVAAQARQQGKDERCADQFAMHW